MRDLEFRADGRFTIAQFTDTHIADLPHNAETFDLFDLALRFEKPDLIVLSGDIVHPTWSKDPITHWHRLIEFFDGRGVPWMFVQGNHDAEGLEYEAIGRVLAQSRLCLYENGPDALSGHGNYAVPIRQRGTTEIGAVIWSLDSGRGAEGVPSGYDWVKEDQIAWFRESSDRIAGEDGREVTGLVFVHMPLPHHLTVWQTRACSGYLNEKVCMQGKDVGLFDAFRERRRISGCFVGHDHTNDYEGELDGVTLAYGRGSGYNCYGREGYRKGARVIILREGIRGFGTHIRLDDGSLGDRPLHEPDGTSMN